MLYIEIDVVGLGGQGRYWAMAVQHLRCSEWLSVSVHHDMEGIE